MARFEGTRGFGFDRDHSPPWLMVSALPPLNQFTAKEVDLWNGAGWTITSADPSIVDISENPDPIMPGTRLINIFGMRPGLAHVLGVPPGGSHAPPLSLLKVEVKRRRRLTIAFNFVVDSHFEKSSVTAANFSQSRTNTSDIFESQANIRFAVTREREITVRTSLRDIIGRQNRGELTYTGNLRGPYHEWFKLVNEGDSGAEINVFFIPRSILDRENVDPPLVFGQDGNIVIEDGGRIERVERELAQWIAIMLGCNRTDDRKKVDHLMSRSTDVTARFIPKEDANLMNPTF